jgi:methyl-accepting chemotaxis protein
MFKVIEKRRKKIIRSESDLEKIVILMDKVLNKMSTISQAKLMRFDLDDCQGLEGEFSNPEIANKWNKLLLYLSLSNNDMITELSNVIDISIKEKSVANMMHSVKNQDSSLRAMENGNKDIISYAKNVSGLVQNMESYVGSAYNKSLESINNINESSNFVKDSFKEVANINDQASEFKSKTQDITNIVDMVAGIAKQTNLLALNASIEAARAGETGRGFAVVAEEVRKLAESTQSCVLNIEGKVTGLHSDIDKFVEKINYTSDKLDKGSQLVGNSVESVNEISSFMKEISNRLKEVSSNLDEQNKSTEQLTSKIKITSDESDNLLKYCNNTSKVLFNINRTVDKVRGRLARMSTDLPEKDWLEVYKVDHSVFVWRIHNMMLGYETLDETFMGDETKCKFGKWTDSKYSKKVKNNSTFKELNEIHKKLHELAKAAIIKYKDGNLDGCEQKYKEMNPVLNTMDELIDKLKKEYN